MNTRFFADHDSYPIDIVDAGKAACPTQESPGFKWDGFGGKKSPTPSIHDKCLRWSWVIREIFVNVTVESDRFGGMR